MSRQTVIPIGVAEDISLENFLGEENKPIIHELQQLVSRKRGKNVIYIWGGNGSGKTHLLDSCCTAANNIERSGLYISLKQGASYKNIFEQATDTSLVCVDDLQEASGDDNFERQLFSLYEKTNSGTGGIVVSGIKPLNSLGIKLKDLESRLSSGGAFNLQTLSDEDKRIALKARASYRGIVLAESVISFIMSHYQRDTSSLFSLLNKLDSASLQSQRKITIPFIKTLL